jgi:hypothetical protein
MSTNLDEHFHENMGALAEASYEPLFTPTGRIRKQRGITRSEVIATFQFAFEMVGGVPRLAVWADANPTEFFKLYGRLLPSSNSNELDGPQEILVKHVLEPPNYNASQNNPAQLHTERDIDSLPSSGAEVGSTRRSPTVRKNRSNDK